MSICYSCFKEFEDNLEICPFCGQVGPVEPKIEIHIYPGVLLAGRYLIGQAIGSGGFGIVYKAWDTKLQVVVAVKEFFMSRLMTRVPGEQQVIVTNNHEEFEYRKARFLAEARDMAKFGSHQSIPNVFEFFEINGTAYIVMELLKGKALNQYIEQVGGRVDIDFAVMVADEVGKALKSLHEKKIIHRDVAPDNIFICTGKNIRIKLMDLGAAKLEDSTDQNIDVILKPGYSPAEQYDRDGQIGPWSDIYALGATLYMMVTGVKPPESTNRKIYDELVPPNELNPEVSENLNNTILKAMALDKHMRFQSAEDFLKALSGERKVISLEQEHKRRRNKRMLSVLAAAMAVLVAFVMVLNTYLSKKEEGDLAAATVSVWFCVAEGSTEEQAMKAVAADFENKFENVTLELKAIPEEEYEAALLAAAEKNELPDLFESSGLSDEILDQARSLGKVMESEQWKNCYFLDQYSDYYSQKKQIPLGIEVPVAYVITNGATYVDYQEDTFEELADFGADTAVALDEAYADIWERNFEIDTLAEKETFLDNEANTSAVMLSSTMGLNEFRTVLVNYEKHCTYYDSDEIQCDFVYEWSIGAKEEADIAASERLLTWMLGNVYQSYLMISECNEGQIPVNMTCFQSKLESRYLKTMEELYEKFVFERK